MLSVNTNEYALYAENVMRVNQLDFKERSERLSSGFRINRGADDPSGLAISSHMDGQIRGMLVNVQNIQDGINLIHYADGFLDTAQTIMLRIRDLAVRMSNEAVNHAPAGANPSDLTPSAPSEMYKETLVLGYQLYVMSRNRDENFNEVKPMATFNDKPIFQGEFEFGQPLQVGPDNATDQRISLIVDDIRTLFLGFALPFVNNMDGTWNETDYMTIGRDLIEKADVALSKVSDIRANLGAQEIRLNHSIQDAMAHYINISASKSRIFDADMSEEAVGLVRSQILNQSTTAAMAQANAQPLTVLDLIDAIYNGLTPDVASSRVSETPQQSEQ